MSSSSLKRDPEESLADRRKRLKAHAEAHFKSTRAAWADLPPDALRLVVKRAADVAGSSVPVVPAVASVCRAWRDAAHAHPSELWRRADFSGDFDPSDAVIARYCRGGHWRQLEHLDLRDCPRVSDKALDALFVDDAGRGAPALSSLFVSDVEDDASRTPNGRGKNSKRTVKVKGKRGISVDGLVRVLERAPNTFGSVEIDRCFVRSGVERERLSRALFANGESLIALALRDAPRMFANVAAFVAPAGMPLLTKLDLTDSGGGAGGAVLPWVDLMVKCPAMRELRLNGLGGAQGWEPKPRVGSTNDPFRCVWGARRRSHGDLPGFPHLEVLELGAARLTTSTGYDLGPSGVSFGLLFRLLAASRNLRELDVTGARGALSLGAFRRERDRYGILTNGEAERERLRLGIAPDTLVGTFFCERGESPLRVLRCARTGWAGSGGRPDDVRAAFFVESSDDALTGASVNARSPRFPDLRVLELGSRGAHAPRVGDEDLVTVVAAGAKTLERLAIAGSAVTDAGAACALARLSPGRFARLDLSHCRGVSRETRRAAEGGDLARARREAAAVADAARVVALDRMCVACAGAPERAGGDDDENG
jgi:F-box/leucine-rich repeat protein 6